MDTSNDDDDDDDDWWLMFYCHFCAYGSLNGPSDLQREWSEVEDETPFRYGRVEIRTQVVVICEINRN